MIYEACQLVVQHLQDGAVGLNALRTTVPMAPLDPPIEPVTIRSEFEVPYIIGDQIPAEAYENGPLVLVRRGDDVGEFSGPGDPELLADSSRLGLAVVLLWPRRNTKDLHHENRALSALLRVTRRSIGMLFEDVWVEERTLRDVQLTGLLGPIRMVPTIARISEVDVVAGAVLFDVKALDRWAEGLTS